MRNRWSISLIVVCTIAVLALFHPAVNGPDAAIAAEPQPPAAKAALFVNITGGKNDLHSVSMALGFAGAAARQGHEVVVFLNVEAPQFAAKELSDSVKTADFAPVKNLLADVMGNGGKVYVCGHCAQVCNVDKAALVPGVVLASHADILGQMKPGMVGLSY